MSAPYVLSPISSVDADRLRTSDLPVTVVDEFPGYPCRQCLRDADVGDEMILVSHDPFDDDSASPYRSASPIFLHRVDCGTPDADPRLPAQLRRRQLSARAFDEHDMMIDAAILDGEHLEATLQRLFANETVEFVHVHNASRGCYATSVRRVE
jgi:hypothetical protein